MANTLQSVSLMAGVATNGMTVNAYHASRFALPATDAAVPDGLAADAGPFTSANDPVQGNGYWTGTVSDQEAYLFSASGGGDGHTYWLGPVTPVVSTTQQDFASVDQGANRRIVQTTISAGSNGAVLPQATINVISTAPAQMDSFLSSGTLIIPIGATFQVITYTGKTGTTFTGCSGGTGTLAGGQAVYQGYVNGAKRRLIFGSAFCAASASGDQAIVSLLATIGGRVTAGGNYGIVQWPSASTFDMYAPVIGVVDPGGIYYAKPTIGGNGITTVSAWIEDDL